MMEWRNLNSKAVPSSFACWGEVTGIGGGKCPKQAEVWLVVAGKRCPYCLVCRNKCGECGGALEELPSGADMGFCEKCTAAEFKQFDEAIAKRRRQTIVIHDTDSEPDEDEDY